MDTNSSIRRLNTDDQIIDFFKSADDQTILSGKDESGTFYLTHLFRIYQQYFGATCSTCPSKILGYINKVKSINIKTIPMKDREYILAEGAVIQVKGSSEAYSNHNLTDEIAKQLLAENPNRAVLFVKIPTEKKEEIKEEIKEVTTEKKEEIKEKSLSKMNKTELTAKAAEIGLTEIEGLSNKDLVKAIEEKTEK